jgi:hypothetical protein
MNGREPQSWHKSACWLFTPGFSFANEERQGSADLWSLDGDMVAWENAGHLIER